METKFIEATQNIDDGFNYGKFMVGRFTEAEWTREAQLVALPGRALLRVCGWSTNSIWIADLQTGEAAFFTPPGSARADLNKKRIWVCVLFEPFLEMLYQFIRTNPESWWDALPNVLELPHAESSFFGYRRSGE